MWIILILESNHQVLFTFIDFVICVLKNGYVEMGKIPISNLRNIYNDCDTVMEVMIN